MEKTETQLWKRTEESMRWYVDKYLGAEWSEMGRAETAAALTSLAYGAAEELGKTTGSATPEVNGWIRDRVRLADWRYAVITGINITRGIATVDLENQGGYSEEWAWNRLTKVDVTPAMVNAESTPANPFHELGPLDLETEEMQ